MRRKKNEVFYLTNLTDHSIKPVRERLQESVSAISAAENCRPIIRTNNASAVTKTVKKTVIQSSRIAAHRFAVRNK